MDKNTLIKICLDYVRNPQAVLNFSEDGQSFDDALRAHFQEILGIKEFSRRALQKQSTKDVVFEIIAEAIEEGFVKGVEEDEFFMQFAETKYLRRGDKNEFYMDEEVILTVSEHAGNNWAIRRQKYEGGKAFSIDTKAYAVGVYGDFQAFMTGRSSFEKLIASAVKALRLKTYELVANAMADAVTALPSQFKASGTYVEDTLIDLFDHVDAASTNAPVIVGTKKALRKIGNDVQWFSDRMKDERNNMGTLGTYLGMDLVQLPVAHKAGTFDFAYADDVLYVLPVGGVTFIKLVIEGDDLINTTPSNTTNIDMNFEYKHISRIGAGVVFTNAFGVYDSIS